MTALGMPGPLELCIVFAIVIVLFGANRLPELIKGVGTSIKEFREAVREGEHDA